MAEGITGWRLHVGVMFPTPVPPRAALEFYEAVPRGMSPPCNIDVLDSAPDI